MPRLILAEDHDIVRHGLRSLLETQPEVEIVGEARNGLSALELCEKLQPELALMDLNMPVMGGLECTRILKKDHPNIKVLILSMQDSENYLIEMLDSGANGYLLKNSCKDELLLAIKKVMDGDTYISSEFTLLMLEKYKRLSREEQPLHGLVLSPGEAKILELVGQGLTNTQMANQLHISVRTVESRRKKLLDKTGTNNTATLIKFAVKSGLIK